MDAFVLDWLVLLVQKGVSVWAYMKVFRFLITGFYWIGFFIVPAGIFGFLSIRLNFKSTKNLPYSIILDLFGTVGGIILAEFVRRK
jgi:hypothetical protein